MTTVTADVPTTTDEEAEARRATVGRVWEELVVDGEPEWLEEWMGPCQQT